MRLNTHLTALTYKKPLERVTHDSLIPKTGGGATKAVKVFVELLKIVKIAHIFLSSQYSFTASLNQFFYDAFNSKIIRKCQPNGTWLTFLGVCFCGISIPRVIAEATKSAYIIVFIKQVFRPKRGFPVALFVA